MILKHLGETIDIHTGGEDHIFPHHEDEIAEAEALTGEPLARYWVHVRFLKLSGKKMAPREGGFIRVSDLAEKGFHPLAFRYLCLQAQFTSSIEFTWEAMQAAQEGWERLQNVVSRLREVGVAGRTSEPVPSDIRQQLDDLDRHFDEALEDNLGTPRALAVLSELLVLANTVLSKQPQSVATLNAIHEQLMHFNEVLALLPVAGAGSAATDLPAPERTWLIAELTKRRELRDSGDYDGADKVRHAIERKGFELSDTKEGVRWLKKATGQRGLYKI
jgi:cysteinyl-tRNA synthetase